MADLNSKFEKLNPFSKRSGGGAQDEDDEDQGEEIDYDTSAGATHGPRLSKTTKNELRVSHALKSYLVHKNALNEKEADLESENMTDALRTVLAKPHSQIPTELLDRSHPLPEYFVSSSHNTYLLAHQLYGTSSAAAYDTALRTGSRCVEIDAWDNEDDLEEPKVTHGYTLVSHIPFRKVCETIRSVLDEEIAANKGTSGQPPAPIMISLENHCNAKGQLRLAAIMREVFGERLITEAVRREGHREQAGMGDQVALDELGSRVAVIVEYHLEGEKDSSDSESEDEAEDDESKKARKAYKEKKKEAPASGIVPELAELGVYAQSVKPVDNSWFEPGELVNGPHHHLINVSEAGLSSHLPSKSELIARHNSKALMRVYPKGTRISSSNLKNVPFWGIGAQICALNWQRFGTYNQLNYALFGGSDGYVLKPKALRAGGSGKLTGPKKKKLLLHVGGATDVPLGKDHKPDSIKPYVSCTLYHPDNIGDSPPKRKTSPYKHHKLGFLHRGDNPPPTDPVWDEVLEWEFQENELTFLRLLIKSDDSWSKNPMVAVAAVRLSYTQPDWVFVRMLDLKGRETNCTLLVKFKIVDA